jgi:glycosyltransferase involved in cell wall biosynthesis
MWYQRRADAIFYPGPAWPDEWGLRARRVRNRQVPLISTLEGLVGTKERENQLSDWAGHRVFCQPVEPALLRRIDYIYAISDHVVAISPFLARLGRKLYGDKFSVHMLGVEAEIFNPKDRFARERPRVINIASVRQRKRPDVFLDVAKRFPEADFIWFGEGNLRAYLTEEAKRRALSNLIFAGHRASADLAHELHSARLFAMPSRDEGVPKATSEAAACGLPLVVFGHYETPTVINGQNGFVVWSDQEFIDRVGTLLTDCRLTASMGQESARMARAWNWDILAPPWEEEILRQIG